MPNELELEPGDPWERRLNEGAKPFRAFTVYLACDVDRSITAVARKLSVSRTLVSRWSVQYNWAERAKLYDERVSKGRLARMEADREKIADQTLAASRQALQLVLRSLGKLKTQKVGAANAARLLAVAVQAWKAVFGDEPLSEQKPTDIKVVVQRNVPRFPQYDYSKLPADLQATLPDYMRAKPKSDA